MTSIDQVLNSIQDATGRIPKRSGTGWMALCPAHDDHNPSLAIKEGDDGRILIVCHAGCESEAVLTTLGLDWSDISPSTQDHSEYEIAATYDYTDEAKTLLYQVVRYRPKKFLQRRPDGKYDWQWNLKGVQRVLYRLPDVIEGVSKDRWILVVEGEKDADRLAGFGLVATTVPGGAGKWQNGYAETFQGAKVAIIPDNDEPGHKHATDIANALTTVASTVRIIKLPGLDDHQDVSDWFNMQGTVEQLKQLIQETRSFDDTTAVTIEPLSVIARRKLGTIGRQEDYIATGIDQIDKELGGMQPQHVWIVCGRPAMGKSALAAYMAYHAAFSTDGLVLFFSLEMSKKALLKRELARISSIPLGDLQRTARERPRFLEDFIDKFPPNYWIDESGNLTVAAILAQAQRVSTQEHKPVAAIFIDYLQIISTTRSQSREQEVARLSIGLKHVAKKLQCTVIAMSQLSRACEQRDNKRPILSDLRDSGQIEQDADVILACYRPNYYDSSYRDDYMEANILKCREGVTGTYYLSFLADTMNFKEWSGLEPHHKEEAKIEDVRQAIQKSLY